MSLQVRTAIKDVTPGISERPPPQLESYCERLYMQSLTKPLKPSNEGARYHLCAYLAVEKYASSLNLPEPQFQRIPLPPKVCLKLISEFKEHMQKFSSAASSPVRGSPGVRSVEPESPTRKGASSPIKMGTNPSNTLDTSQSPFNDSPNPVQSNGPSNGSNVNGSNVHISSPLTPRKGRGRPRKEGTMKNFMDSSPSKSSPLKKLRAAAGEDDEPDTPSGSESPFWTPNSKTGKYTASEVSISIPNLVQLCNTFFIPGYITVHIIQEFLNERHKFVRKSDWLLAFGLIYAAYLRINHKLFKDKPNYGDVLINQFHRHRRQLRKISIVYWTTVINEGVSNSSWIIDLEQTFMHGVRNDRSEDKEKMYKLGPKYNAKNIFGSMITPTSDLLSDSQTCYYNTWTSNVLQQLKE